METTTEKKNTLVNVDLSEIRIGKSNPRKEFDEDSINELAASIKQHGVLQPVLLRNVAGGYELVCGERRYRASQLAGLEQIPANIREISDDEALELQIIENLQRKDVHPMEEASAFKALIEHKKFTVDEIAKRVGKGARYVAERLKLNDLVPDFQKAFYKNRLNLVSAMKVCKLSPEDQQDIYREETEENFGPKDGKIEISDSQIRSYQGDLNNPAFDKTDADLHKKMGACTNCQFNTSCNTLLFPEAVTNARCLNTSCYKQKTEVSFDRELKKVLADPLIELVSDEWYTGKFAKELISKGHVVHQKSTGYSSIDRPELPEKEHFVENYEDGDYETVQDMEKAYKKALDQHTKEMAEYQKAIDGGKYIRAFVVEGDEKGKYIYITLKKGKAVATSAGVKAKEEAGKVTAEDIAGEISRIRDREKRNKELDGEKMNVELGEIFVKQKNFLENTGAIKYSEKIALIIILAEFAGYDTRGKVYKAAGCNARYNDDYKYIKLYKTLENMATGALDSALNNIVRIMLADKLITQASCAENSGKAAALEHVLSDYNLKAVQQVAKDQDEIAKARAERVEKRIADLNAKKKDLVPAKKTVATKSSKKK